VCILNNSKYLKRKDVPAPNVFPLLVFLTKENLKWNPMYGKASSSTAVVRGRCQAR
jgi:hypothetical protein